MSILVREIYVKQIQEGVRKPIEFESMGEAESYAKQLNESCYYPMYIMPRSFG